MVIYLHGEVQPQSKSGHFFNARPLMMREIMHSRDVQSNTGEFLFVIEKRRTILDETTVEFYSNCKTQNSGFLNCL